MPAVAATSYAASISSLDSDESASTFVGIYEAKARSTRLKDEGSIRVVRVGRAADKKKVGGLRRFFSCSSDSNLD